MKNDSKKRPTLTVGMAHFDDYDGLYFTIQSIRSHQTQDVELIVVDNSPRSPHGQHVKGLLDQIPNSKYVPLPDAVGTSVPRDRVFREASGDVVLCMDCHVLLMPGAIDALLATWDEFLDERPHMVTGPLLTDRLTLYATHFNDQWRAEMWGTWGVGWQCPCQSIQTGGFMFSPVQPKDDDLIYVSLADQKPVSKCPRCNKKLPRIGWAGHERALDKAGYQCLANRSEPFEIPGMGLGVFSMRRTDWVGFHPEARGFGGEEMYVHAKVRKAGGKVWCDPKFRWLHRFGRPGGVRYPISRQTKVRNYVLEFMELGLDLTPIRTHFVDSGLLSVQEWDALVADPVKFLVQPPKLQNATPAGGCGNTQKTASHFPQPPDGDHNLDTLFDWCASVPRDLDKHANTLREYAAKVSHVTAVVKRREWDVFLLAGRPDDVVIYTSEQDTLHDTLHRVIKATETNPRAPRRIKNYTVHAGGHPHDNRIAKTDLLAIDTVHHGNQLRAELESWAPSVSRFIVLRGTQAFAEVAEGGNGPGLLVALRQFCRQHPEWSVVYHSSNQYGLTVLSRQKADKPKPPGVLKLAENFAKAVAEHVADGLATVEVEQLEERLTACSICDQRTGTRCAVCGCHLERKAALRSSHCPLDRWPETTAPTQATATEPEQKAA